ncbi:NAD(P)/FAD-dependent oxidoreductase [uncultured Methanobrevibacter sp.]|uniref:geranylgeranyl reductase family protein n=1 Tax=uncultured Methanobrevibacter sp. TaxID=253161 RepID=UPI0025EC8895|nr:NAD(P)/FAD-dependent oxidoreductase [uncultured Methanobrevibacter sp.]
MTFDFDVAIIGGGPVGSSLGYKLQKQGLSVAIFEKKKNIGFPLQCAGILSKSIFDVNDLPHDLILNQVKGAYLHSPNQTMKVKKDAPEAYIIDRVGYDHFLLDRARNSGVKVFMQQKVIELDIDNGFIISNKGQYSAKVIVGADGANSIVSSILGNDYKYFTAAQFLVNLSNEDKEKLDGDYVDIFINGNITPGFIWSIPLDQNLFRIGLFSKKEYRDELDILNDFLKGSGDFKNNNLNLNDYEIIEKYQGMIPIYNKNKILQKGRVILIGDAAGQVKPTTGGGLLCAFNCINMASDVIYNSINNDNIDLLENYSKECRNLYFDEFSNEIKVHKTLGILSDKGFDYLFKKVKDNDGERIISEYGHMDNQSVLIKKFIKEGLLYKITQKFIKSKISKIWKN